MLLEALSFVCIVPIQFGHVLARLVIKSHYQDVFLGIHELGLLSYRLSYPGSHHSIFLHLHLVDLEDLKFGVLIMNQKAVWYPSGPFQIVHRALLAFRSSHSIGLVLYDGVIGI